MAVHACVLKGLPYFSIPKMSFRVCACVCRRETEFLAIAHHENIRVRAE